MFLYGVGQPFIFRLGPGPFRHTAGNRIAPAPTAILIRPTRNALSQLTPQKGS